MASYATFPALIATFQADWGLSNTGAGWISGSYFAGVAIGTLVLASLTDRWSGKRVYLPSMALAAIAALGFALLADGLWSASFWRFLQGVAPGRDLSAGAARTAAIDPAPATRAGDGALHRRLLCWRQPLLLSGRRARKPVRLGRHILVERRRADLGALPPSFYAIRRQHDHRPASSW